jgi:hypothetical protein
MPTLPSGRSFGVAMSPAGTRAGWRERTAAAEAAPAAEGDPHSEILLLPDNCRDHELTAALRDAQRQFFARKRPQR